MPVPSKSQHTPVELCGTQPEPVLQWQKAEGRKQKAEGRRQLLDVPVFTAQVITIYAHNQTPRSQTIER